jgi:hypothetical protein
MAYSSKKAKRQANSFGDEISVRSNHDKNLELKKNTSTSGNYYKTIMRPLKPLTTSTININKWIQAKKNFKHQITYCGAKKRAVTLKQNDPKKSLNSRIKSNRELSCIRKTVDSNTPMQILKFEEKAEFNKIVEKIRGFLNKIEMFQMQHRAHVPKQNYFRLYQYKVQQ